MTCDRKIGVYPCCSVVEGDCLELMKALPNGCVDCGHGEGSHRRPVFDCDCACCNLRELFSISVVSDPQYQLAGGKKATTMGLSAKRSDHRPMKGTMVSNRDWGIMRGDDEPFDPAPFLKFPKVILWGASHYASRLPDSSAWLIWDKRDGVASDDNGDAELAWTNLSGPARLHRQLWKGVCRAGEENISIQGDKLHPFQKPIALMTWCVGMIPAGETILDPFCGSGTTLVAAKKLGRHYLGFEISHDYCEIARKRLAEIDAQPSLFEPKPEQLTLEERP